MTILNEYRVKLVTEMIKSVTYFLSLIIKNDLGNEYIVTLVHILLLIIVSGPQLTPLRVIQGIFLIDILYRLTL